MRIELGGARPFLQQRARVHNLDAPGILLLDAHNMTFASPLELAGIVAYTHAVSHGGGIVDVNLPADPNVAAYLARMDVLHHLTGHAFLQSTPPPSPRHDRAATLTEVTLVDASTAHEFADRLGRIIRDRLDPPLRKAAFSGVGELVDNAVTHGRSEPGAFAAAQFYTGKSSTLSGMEFAICDTGIGVLSHLRYNPAYRHLIDAQSALGRAIEPGVTGTGEHRGYGLHDLLSIKDGYVRLLLRSGDGLAHVVAPGGGERRVATAPAQPVPGTWAWLRVRNP